MYRDILSLYQDTSATAAVRQHRAVAAEDPAALALDAAQALRQAGDPAEAYRQLRTLASRYPGSRPAEEARRLMRLMETGDPQTVSGFLRQATDAQTAGRLLEARRLWEWVGAMYPRSAAADEAHRRLQQLTKLEQAGREQAVTEALQQAITLEEKGDLEGARQVLAGILTQSRDTPAYEAVRRRQRQLEDALAKRESARQLQEAADLEKRGLLQAARATGGPGPKISRHACCQRSSTSAVALGPGTGSLNEVHGKNPPANSNPMTTARRSR